MMSDRFKLFFESKCVACGETLLNKEKVVCFICDHEMSTIKQSTFEKDHPFWGRTSVDRVFSYTTYLKTGSAETLLHKFKYQGIKEISIMV